MAVLPPWQSEQKDWAWQEAQVPESWWKPYGPLLTYLDINAEPWQIEECWRLVKQHGHEKFIGMDLFGVV